MKEIKTKSGLDLKIDENILDDMELFDAVAELQDGNGMLLPKIVGKVFGEQKKTVYDHCRTEDGRVPVQAVSEIVSEVFDALNGKNS